MFKPLLACPAEHIQFPIYASVKIDGIRCCILPGHGAVTRKIKKVPNTYIREILNSCEVLQYCDGEIVTFDENNIMHSFNQVQSQVMSESGEPKFIYYIFDNFKEPKQPYSTRQMFLPQGASPNTMVLKQFFVTNHDELNALEEQALADGWEGLMVRSFNGVYKYGRSTAKEGILLKVVRRQRAEGTVTGCYERLHNANEATLDELGYTKRSSHKDNKIGRGDLGGLNLLWEGIAFDCGTGMDDALRTRLWQERESLLGKIVTFEYRGTGTNGKPRFPAFIGFRDPADM